MFVDILVGIFLLIPINGDVSIRRGVCVDLFGDWGFFFRKKRFRKDSPLQCLGQFK